MTAKKRILTAATMFMIVFVMIYASFYIAYETEHEVCICMRDQGVPFDPFAKEDPDITLSADEREIGGLGIYMVKTIMDIVSYEYKQQENIVTMIKKWQI